MARGGDRGWTMHSWAAFAREDVEDAKRGAPPGDLRAYAAARGLTFADRAQCLPVHALQPRHREHLANAVQGVLGGRRYGAIGHELLETSVSQSESSTRIGMGGDFHGAKLAGARLTFLSFVPVVGTIADALRSEGDVPFPELTAVLPTTAALVHVPEATLLPSFTARPADRLANGDRLRDEGLGTYRVAANDLTPELRRAIFAGPVRETLLALSNAGFVELRHLHGALLLQVNGYLMEDVQLDRLVELLLAAADGLAAVPAPDPPPVGRFDTWDETLTAATARFGLTLESPVALHRAHPDLPVPGRARAVLAGTLPNGVVGRLCFTQYEPSSSTLQAAALFPLAPGAASLPPGGVYHETTDMLVGTSGDLVAAWKRSPDHGELAVTSTAERGWAAVTALGLAAG